MSIATQAKKPWSTQIPPRRQTITTRCEKFQVKIARGEDSRNPKMDQITIYLSPVPENLKSVTISNNNNNVQEVTLGKSGSWGTWEVFAEGTIHNILQTDAVTLTVVMEENGTSDS